jgi:hypothetical protein
MLIDPRACLATLQAGIEQARRLGMGPTSALLVTNAAGVAIRTGDWRWSEGLLDETLTTVDDAGHRARLLGAKMAFGDLRGDDTSRSSAELEQLVSGSENAVQRATHADLLGQQALAQRRLADAHQHYHESALDESDVEAYLPAALMSILAGNPDEAQRDLAVAEMSPGVFGRAIEAQFDLVRAGILALDGQTADAQALFRRVLRAWRDLRLPWDEAIAGLIMASVLDPSEPEVAEAADASRRIFESLGANPFVAWIDDLTGHELDAESHPSVERSGEATEVLPA